MANKTWNITNLAKAFCFCTFQTDPYFMEKRNDALTTIVGNDRYEGYIPDLMHEVSDIVGFNYTLTPVKDGK